MTPSTATLTISDDDVAGIIEFGAPVFDIAENAGSAIITVARRNGTASGATVNYTTSDGTATRRLRLHVLRRHADVRGGRDHARPSRCRSSTTAWPKAWRRVNLTLSTPGGGATLGARTSALLRIIDDERALGFSAPNYTVSEGAGTATITVELTGVSATDTIAVNYATSNGTATAGLDYTTATGTLVFPPGGTATGIRTKTFTVPILQDTLAEGIETINLTLSLPTPAGRRPAGHRALDGHPQHRRRRRGRRDRVRWRRPSPAWRARAPRSSGSSARRTGGERWPAA